MAHQNEVVIDIKDHLNIETVTYAFLPENSIPVSFKSAFEQAFRQWSQVIPIDFIEDQDNFSTSDIQIGFYETHCGCGATVFSPESLCLAHTNVRAGRICMNANYKWVVDLDEDGSTDAIDLKSVATHEIGHVLGLTHSESLSSVMYKSFRPRERRSILCADDVEQMQRVYRQRPVNPLCLICLMLAFIFFGYLMLSIPRPH